MRKRMLIVFAVVLPLSIAMIAAMAASAAPPAATPTVTPHWVTGLAAGSGSTVGPDGALYVPETDERPYHARRSRHRSAPRSRAACPRG